MSEFPPSLGKVALPQLAGHGITRFDQLPQLSTKDLLAIHGVGPKAVRILSAELAVRGLKLRDG